ncbi:MAG: hypothetical protein U5L09_22195 [Bacteroidales bacterium]|nr:hypothetical protein [Bacteroidales bacterium]
MKQSSPPLSFCFLLNLSRKATFRIHSNGLLQFFSIPVTIFYYLFYPVIIIYLKISEFIIKKLFRVKTMNRKADFTYVDLDHYLKEFAPENKQESNIQQELQMFQNVIDFKTVKLRECMVPRTEVVAVSENDPVEVLKNAFRRYRSPG